MNYIYLYAAGFCFLLGCAISYHRGYRIGYDEGTQQAEGRATKLWYNRSYSRN